MKALLLVDIENDFLPGGALEVENGDRIVPVVNHLMKKGFDLIVASKDWHPEGHCSFASTHGKKPGDVIEINGLRQILWPIHCVQGTPGAEFAPELNEKPIEKIFHKGTNPNIDSYSAFFDNAHNRSTGLHEYLQSKNITDVYIAGLATDYCVKYSVVDALRLGYNVHVIEDGCCGVNLKPNDSQEALQEMRTEGANVISSKAV